MIPVINMFRSDWSFFFFTQWSFF